MAYKAVATIKDSNSTWQQEFEISDLDLATAVVEVKKSIESYNLGMDEPEFHRKLVDIQDIFESVEDDDTSWMMEDQYDEDGSEWNEDEDDSEENEEI